MKIFRIQLSHAVCETDCNGKKTHKHYSQNFRSQAKAQIDNQDGSQDNHGDSLGNHQNRVDYLPEGGEGVHKDSQNNCQNQRNAHAQKSLSYGDHAVAEKRKPIRDKGV